MKQSLAILTILLMLGISAHSQSVTINPTGITPASSSTSYAVGQSYGGGIIFFVYDNGQHGLIASLQDIPVPFSNIGNYTTWSAVNSNTNLADLRTIGAYADGIGGGMYNTMLINSVESSTIGLDAISGSYAALLCSAYKPTMDGIIYADWYLPSKYELNLMYQKRAVIGNITNDYYWTSNEGDHGFPPNNTPYVWVQQMGDGMQTQGLKSDVYKVRAVRRF